MGGRGGSSGMGDESNGLHGMDVTVNGETTRYYFSSQDGVNYYQRGIGADPTPTPLNMSQKEFKERVENNGAITRKISTAERKKDMADYKEDRKQTNEFLNMSDAQLAGNRGDQRRATRGRRGGRRGI